MKQKNLSRMGRKKLIRKYGTKKKNEKKNLLDALEKLSDVASFNANGEQIIYGNCQQAIHVFKPIREKLHLVSFS